MGPPPVGAARADLRCIRPISYPVDPISPDVDNAGLLHWSRQKGDDIVEPFQQSEVSRAVWPWPDGGANSARPKGMSPRKKVLITTPIALMIAGGIYLWRGHAVMPGIVVGIALTICFCGLFVPRAFAAIERFFAGFARIVATTMTWILLVPVFYLVFAPAHLMLRIRGKDPMFRQCPSDEPTYWTARPPVTRKGYYESQH